MYALRDRSVLEVTKGAVNQSLKRVNERSLATHALLNNQSGKRSEEYVITIGMSIGRRHVLPRERIDRTEITLHSNPDGNFGARMVGVHENSIRF